MRSEALRDIVSNFKEIDADDATKFLCMMLRPAKTVPMTACTRRKLFRSY